jgi:ribosomal protein S18 acetylase RimI-like enzyme
MNTFRANLADWQPKANTSGLDEEQSAWNEKLKDTLMYLKEAQERAGNADRVVGVFVSGAPVGFAVLDKRNDPLTDPHEHHVYLSALVVHPGSRRAGGMLIEQAASISQEWGSEGRVRVRPGSLDSDSAYKALGFTDALDDEECLELCPAETAGWGKLGDVWSLSKFHGKTVLY